MLSINAVLAQSIQNFVIDDLFSAHIKSTIGKFMAFIYDNSSSSHVFLFCFG